MIPRSGSGLWSQNHVWIGDIVCMTGKPWISYPHVLRLNLCLSPFSRSRYLGCLTGVGRRPWVHPGPYKIRVKGHGDLRISFAVSPRWDKSYFLDPTTGCPECYGHPTFLRSREVTSLRSTVSPIPPSSDLGLTDPQYGSEVKHRHTGTPLMNWRVKEVTIFPLFSSWIG